MSKDLSDIRNHLYNRAEKLWWITLYIALGTQAIVLAAVWGPNKTFSAIAAILSFLAPIAIVWLREHALTITTKADKCRRLILYSDGLGRHISSGDLAQVRAWALGWELTSAPFVKPYYASEKPVGPSRLADIMTESAFFTMNFAERMVFWLRIVLLVSAIMVMGMLWAISLILEEGGITGPPVVSAMFKSAAFVLAFLMSSDFVLLHQKYGELRVLAKEVFDQCARLRDDKTMTESGILLISEDYSLALIQSPPIPLCLYVKYRDAMNIAYRSAADNRQGKKDK